MVLCKCGFSEAVVCQHLQLHVWHVLKQQTTQLHVSFMLKQQR